MTTHTLESVVEALTGIPKRELVYDGTAPRITVTVPTRTDFAAACTALGLEPKDAPTQTVGQRAFFAADGPLNTAQVVLFATSTMNDPDWEDPA